MNLLNILCLNGIFAVSRYNILGNVFAFAPIINLFSERSIVSIFSMCFMLMEHYNVDTVEIMAFKCTHDLT